MADKNKINKKVNEIEENFSDKLISHWRSLKKKPQIIVFDLDYTLWPFYADCHITPPLKKVKKNGEEILVDSTNYEIHGFKHVDLILKTLKCDCLDESKNQHLAVARLGF
jgi:hypothetical protein